MAHCEAPPTTAKTEDNIGSHPVMGFQWTVLSGKYPRGTGPDSLPQHTRQGRCGCWTSMPNPNPARRRGPGPPCRRSPKSTESCKKTSVSRHPMQVVMASDAQCRHGTSKSEEFLFRL